MTKRTFISTDLPQMIELYNQGKSTVDIGKIYGVHYSTVKYHLNKAGVRIRTTSEAMYYKHGTTIEGRDERYRMLRSIKQCPFYVEWRAKVMVRDKFTCQLCGYQNTRDKPTKEIHIDHIKRFSIIIKENKISSLADAIKCDELWDINNGRCLCVDCHRKTGTYGGKYNQ